MKKKSNQSLAETQKIMKAALKLQSGGWSKSKLNIRKSRPISSRKRLQIYQSSYRDKIIQSLQEDFPMLLKALGKRRFVLLLEKYLSQFPSQTWTLATVGQQMPLFLREFSPWMEQPELAEIASLDWLSLLTLEAHESHTLDLERLQSLNEMAVETLHLKLHPSVFLFEARNFTGKLKSKKHGFSKQNESSYFFIVTMQNRMKPRQIQTEEWNILSKIKNECTVPELLSFIEAMALPKERIVKFFFQWSKEGIIAFSN
jgi:hypothetical protein